MKPIHFLLVFLLLAIGLTTFLILMGEPPNGHGMPHASIAGMQQVGDAWGRTEPILLHGTILGVLIYLIMITALYMSVVEEKRTTAFKLAMLGATVVVMIVWFAMISSYTSWLQGDDPSVVMGFPAPTAWTLYGIWMSPLGFTFIYVFGFRHWFFTEADEARFNELLKEKKNNND
ncbi:MAG: hypothetical protein AAF512_19480 [Pseudomonadota bacterium]